jgi:hypothetical protein
MASPSRKTISPVDPLDLTKQKMAPQLEDKIWPVKPVDLTEKISPVCGDYTTISILKPVMYVERTADKFYRITTSFTLEVGIIGFHQESVTLILCLFGHITLGVMV